MGSSGAFGSGASGGGSAAGAATGASAAAASSASAAPVAPRKKVEVIVISSDDEDDVPPPQQLRLMQQPQQPQQAMRGGGGAAAGGGLQRPGQMAPPLWQFAVQPLPSDPGLSAADSSVPSARGAKSGDKGGGPLPLGGPSWSAGGAAAVAAYSLNAMPPAQRLPAFHGVRSASGPLPGSASGAAAGGASAAGAAPRGPAVLDWGWEDDTLFNEAFDQFMPALGSGAPANGSSENGGETTPAAGGGAGSGGAQPLVAGRGGVEPSSAAQQGEFAGVGDLPRPRLLVRFPNPRVQPASPQQLGGGPVAAQQPQAGGAAGGGVGAGGGGGGGGAGGPGGVGPWVSPPAALAGGAPSF